MLKPLFKYADFNGRARRSEYWLFFLFQVIAYIGIIVVTAALAASGSILTGVGIGLLMFVVVALGCFLPNLAVTVRRLHDSGRSAWWLLLYLPGLFANLSNPAGMKQLSQMGAAGSGADAYANLMASQMTPLAIIAGLCNLVMFAYMVWPGAKGPNRFGDDPRGGGLDLSVFDAPRSEDLAEPVNKTPHKPIFDFTSPEPAAAAPAPAPVQPAPAQYTPSPTVAPAGRQAPVFGKRR